jgi:2-polyprenyl-3-methyl-5-hydroxy-6-metoxy-1,4-benzoquinol methylase
MSNSYIEHEIDGRGTFALSFMPQDCHTLLDAGCSHGYSTKVFATKAQHTVAIDIDAEAIAVAQARYPYIEFHVASLDAIPMSSDTADCIICTDVVEHVENEIAVFNEFYRVMRPNAVAIITTPHAGLFQWLDSYNFQYYLRKHAYPAYRIVHKILRGKEPTKKKPDKSELHRHYTIDDFCSILDNSDFSGNYELIKVHRVGLLFDPLSYLIAHAGGFFFQKLPTPIYYLCRLFHKEFSLSFGSWAYNIGIVVKKKQ